METQEDTIFIQNLPKDVTESSLAEHFGGIGVIKVRSSLGPIHTGRAIRFAGKPFDVACNLCEHSH